MRLRAARLPPRWLFTSAAVLGGLLAWWFLEGGAPEDQWKPRVIPRQESTLQSDTAAQLRGTASRDGTDVATASASSLRVRTVDERGNQLPGSRVSLMRHDEAAGGPPRSLVATVRTDNDGVALLPLGTERTGYFVHARNEEYAPAAAPVPDEGLEIRMVLHRGRELSGHVVSDDGNPMPDLEIAIVTDTLPRPDEAAVPLDSAAPLSIRVVSGEDGAFRCVVPTGTYRLGIRSPKFILKAPAWAKLPGIRRVPGSIVDGNRVLAAAGDTDVKLVAVPWCVCGVRLVDAETGDPVVALEGTSLALAPRPDAYDEHWAGVAELTQGRAELPLAEGEYVIGVRLRSNRPRPSSVDLRVDVSGYDATVSSVPLQEFQEFAEEPQVAVVRLTRRFHSVGEITLPGRANVPHGFAPSDVVRTIVTPPKSRPILLCGRRQDDGSYVVRGVPTGTHEIAFSDEFGQSERVRLQIESQRMTRVAPRWPDPTGILLEALGESGASVASLAVADRWLDEPEVAEVEVYVDGTDPTVRTIVNPSKGQVRIPTLVRSSEWGVARYFVRLEAGVHDISVGSYGYLAASVQAVVQEQVLVRHSIHLARRD